MIDLKNDACFVTAFYHDLYDTKFGGRAGRYHHYINSLKSISKINSNLFIYCKPDQIENLKNELESRNYSNTTYVGYNLETFKYHEQFNNLLNGKNKAWHDRCFEIMHGKLYWLKEVLEKTNYKYYYWIDAGLSYCGLFPKKFLGEEYGYLAKFYEFSLFSNKVFSNMLALSGEQNSFFITGQKPFLLDNFKPKEILFANKEKFDKFHVVGGLFGGTKDFLQHLVTTYDDYLKTYTEKGMLLSEEGLLTEIASNYPDNTQKLESFDCWHHEDSGDVFQVYVQRSKQPFYTIFSKYDV